MEQLKSMITEYFTYFPFSNVNFIPTVILSFYYFSVVFYLFLFFSYYVSEDIPLKYRFMMDHTMILKTGHMQP